MKYTVTVTFSESGAYSNEIEALNKEDAIAKILQETKDEGCILSLDTWGFAVQEQVQCPKCHKKSAWTNDKFIYCTDSNCDYEKHL